MLCGKNETLEIGSSTIRNSARRGIDHRRDRGDDRDAGEHRLHFAERDADARQRAEQQQQRGGEARPGPRSL
jgi:hypothetical protein